MKLETYRRLVHMFLEKEDLTFSEIEVELEVESRWLQNRFQGARSDKVSNALLLAELLSLGSVGGVDPADLNMFLFLRRLSLTLRLRDWNGIRPLYQEIRDLESSRTFLRSLMIALRTDVAMPGGGDLDVIEPRAHAILALIAGYFSAIGPLS